MKINKNHTYIFIKKMPNKRKIIFTAKILNVFPNQIIVWKYKLLKNKSNFCLYNIYLYMSKYNSLYKKLYNELLKEECLRDKIDFKTQFSIPKKWIIMRKRLICGIFPKLHFKMPDEILLYIEDFL